MKNYPKYIQKPVNVDKCSKYKCRFSLTAKTICSTKSINKNKILVIMMNPSKATEHKTDNTVYKIIEHAYRFLTAKEITILNLYPFYQPDSNELKNTTSNYSKVIYKSLMAKNEEIVNQYLRNKYDMILLAWGNVPPSFSKDEHKMIVNNILKNIQTNQLSKSLYVYSYKKFKGLSKEHNPYHPSRKGKILGIQRVDSIYFESNKYKINLCNIIISNQELGIEKEMKAKHR